MNKLYENFNNLLPLNRKERFYTGTVLPGIICSDNFKNINLFFNLIPNFNLEIKINPDADGNNVLFQTEYSFKESLTEKHFKEKFLGEYETKDTPDLVILVTEPELILFVGEAKMYSNVNPGEINTQMKNQEWFIAALQKGLKIKKKIVSILHYCHKDLYLEKILWIILLSFGRRLFLLITTFMAIIIFLMFSN